MKDYKDYHVGIIGSGLIGAGWATHLLIHGVREITLYDTAPQALDRAKGLISQGLAFFEENGAITAAQRAELEGLPVYTTVMRAAVEGADLILENGPENLELKRTILAGIEAECRDDAVITSSTSGIMISEIARDASHPERVIGAHPYLPVYLLPLVEIVISPKVGENYLNQALTFFRAVGKKPVVLRKNSPGYVGTRLMIALFRESAKIVSSGVCSLEDLDTAFTFGPGLRYALMGPYMVYQLTGGDGGFKNTMCGPMGQSSEKWLGELCSWDRWPEEVHKHFETDWPAEILDIMSRREPGTGRDNAELQAFRDKGLLELLRYHKLI